MNRILKFFTNIETKAYATIFGGGGGAVIAGFVLWLLGVYVWGAPFDAAHAEQAAAAVPAPVAGLVGVVLSALGAFWAAWIAPHTNRPKESVHASPQAVPQGESQGFDPDRAIEA